MNDKLSTCKDCGIFYPIPDGFLGSEFCDECRVDCHDTEIEYDTKKYENTYTFEIVDGKTKLKDCYEREQLCQKTNKKISWMSWVKKQLRKLRSMKK